MQQNARVIILTLDAARAAGLELARPLDALEAAAAASPSSSSSSDPSSSPADAGLNGRARPTPSTERSAALSSIDDDDSESDDDDEGGSERGGEPSTSSLFDRPAGFAAVALPPPPPSLSGFRPITPLERTRGVAATLLLSFLGARLNSAYSLNAFVETVAAEYRSGRTAAALLSPLTDEELASVGADAGLKVVAPTSKNSGSPFRGGNGGESGNGNGDDDDDAADAAPATAGSGAAAAGRALLSQWVSISYMTMAQMGVPHSLAGSPGAQGWAFAGSSGSGSGSSSSSPPSASASSSLSSLPSLSPSEAAAEALALDRLVRATLRQLAEEKGAPPAPASETLEAFRRGGEARAREATFSSSSSSPAAAASFMRVSDPSLVSTSSALEVWGMALGVSRATAELVASKAEEWGLFDEEGGSDLSSPSSSSSEMAAAGEQS